jgi:hypothetical protein
VRVGGLRLRAAGGQRTSITDYAMEHYGDDWMRTITNAACYVRTWEWNGHARGGRGDYGCTRRGRAQRQISGCRASKVGCVQSTPRNVVTVSSSALAPPPSDDEAAPLETASTPFQHAHLKPRFEKVGRRMVFHYISWEYKLCTL